MAFAIPTAGLEIACAFDGDLTDHSGNGRDLTGLSVVYESGVIDQALEIKAPVLNRGWSDGVPDVAIAATDVSLWFRFKLATDVPAETGSLNFVVGESGRFVCYIKTNASLFEPAAWVENGTGGDEFGGVTVAADNAWHAVLFEWADATSIMRCVFDGTELYAQEHPSGVDSIIEDAGSINLPGTWEADPLGEFHLDHVCLWNRVLTAGEISGLMELPIEEDVGGGGNIRQTKFLLFET